jgi:hypothetical protein
MVQVSRSIQYISFPSLRLLPQDLLEICSLHLTQISAEGVHAHPVFAVTNEGIDLLLSPDGVDEVALLQVAMTACSQIDDTVKRQLLFGLLLPRELTLIKEDGTIIAPIPEIALGSAPELRGDVAFLAESGPDIQPPDSQSICLLRGICGGRPVHQLIRFILDQLLALPADESLLGHPFHFRLKSYSSVMNKLFYRGKTLTDLLAATVGTDADLSSLKRRLSGKGAVLVGQENCLNGNGDLSNRYVRILRVSLEGCSSFDLPVYYEVILTRHTTHVSHKQYEWNRLKCRLDLGQRSALRRNGFTLEMIVRPGGHTESSERVEAARSQGGRALWAGDGSAVVVVGGKLMNWANSDARVVSRCGERVVDDGVVSGGEDRSETRREQRTSEKDVVRSGKEEDRSVQWGGSAGRRKSALCSLDSPIPREVKQLILSELRHLILRPLSSADGSSRASLVSSREEAPNSVTPSVAVVTLTFIGEISRFPLYERMRGGAEG